MNDKTIAGNSQTFTICGETLLVKDHLDLYGFVIADRFMSERHIKDEMSLLKTKDVLVAVAKFEQSFNDYLKMNERRLAREKLYEELCDDSGTKYCGEDEINPPPPSFLRLLAGLARALWFWLWRRLKTRI